ncbi:MAG: hypothetical protein HUK02_03430 [Bacteroidaceae bacterium]|nr:hypothetical protein [Bacteroidaceae bacterium]
MRKLLVLLALLCGVASYAAKPRKIQRVYMFGVTQSFNDSVCFLTDLQAVDSVRLEPNGFLTDRTLYMLQCGQFVASQMHINDATTAIFFSPKKATLEKKYLKVRRRFQREKGTNLVFLGTDQFRFKPETWTEETEQAGDEKPKK